MLYTRLKFCKHYVAAKLQIDDKTCACLDTSAARYARRKTSTRLFQTHPLNRLVAYPLIKPKGAEVCR